MPLSYFTGGTNFVNSQISVASSFKPKCCHKAVDDSEQRKKSKYQEVLIWHPDNIYRKVTIAPDYICLWIKPKCSLNRMMAFTQIHQWATILRFLPSIWFLQRRKYCLWLDVILQKGHQSMPPYLTFYGSRIISNIWSLHLPIISLLATNNTICLIFHLSNFGRKGKGECHKTKKSKKSFL